MSVAGYNYNSFNLYEKDCRSPSQLEGFERLQISSHHVKVLKFYNLKTEEQWRMAMFTLFSGIH
jgi:hypothetical protein